MASGKATPHGLVFFEGICRFGVMFLSGCYSVENGEWHHRDNDDDVPTPVGNPLEEAWERAMTVKAQLREDLDIGAWFVPVVVFTDMAPDDDVIDETRGRKVWLLWGLDDLVERLIELPERDDLYPRLNARFIAKEIDALSQQAPRDAPAPEQMALDLGAGLLVLQRAETVNICGTIAASVGTDGGPLQVTVEGQ